jgi:hypothetical protein
VRVHVEAFKPPIVLDVIAVHIPRAAWLARHPRTVIDWSPLTSRFFPNEHAAR